MIIKISTNTFFLGMSESYFPCYGNGNELWGETFIKGDVSPKWVSQDPRIKVSLKVDQIDNH